MSNNSTLTTHLSAPDDTVRDLQTALAEIMSENSTLKLNLGKQEQQTSVLETDLAKSSSEIAKLKAQLHAKNQQITALLNGLTQAQAMLRSPLKSALNRNFAKFALKYLPMLSESRREKLRRSIDKREYRTMFGLLNTEKRLPSNVIDIPLTIVKAPAFSTAASERWKLELRSQMTAQLEQERPLVSIVMATKNRVGSIPQAINSVINQSYDNWELIIIDDGSSDGTHGAILELFPDPRIRIKKSNGSGVCDARNFGIGESRGDIIAYLDDDNRWHHDYLEVTLLQMLRAKADCCYSVQQRFPHGLDNPKGAEFLQRSFDLKKLKHLNYIDLNVFAHRRSVSDDLGVFDKNLQRLVDWDLIIRYCEKYPPTFCNSVGADYDNSKKADRISVKESISYLYVVRNKHLIDWTGLRTDFFKRDRDLVSIIICVYNNPDLTNSCLESLVRHEAGLPFEIVLVDNGSNAQTVALLRDWAAREPRIKLLLNPENMNFSLGNNLGFAISRGANVVFLNNDTQVTPEWLRSLIAPLTNENILGVQPTLVFPDGSIQCIGLVFSDHSPFAYGLHTKLAGDDPLVGNRRSFKAITAACLAMRARDFLEAGGFDPHYINGQEDVDLCLRIGGGRPVFTCATDAVVIHHEGKSEGRRKAISYNRNLFADRWKGKVSADDQFHYKQDAVMVERYIPDAEALEKIGLATQIPEIKYASKMAPAIHFGLTGFRIRIACPSAVLKDRWGDYHFAVALSRAAARLGVTSRIDFLDSWGVPSGKGEVDIVLRGLSAFQLTRTRSDISMPKNSNKKLIWIISHPEKISDQELDGYDKIFVASDHWAKELGVRLTKKEIKTLLQCTEIERFNLQARIDAPRHDRLFVGNSRKVLRSSVAKAMKEGIRLDIYGEMWEGLAPADWIKGENVANVDLPSYYAGAGVVLNDHWDTMRSHGFVSNRIFDVLATGTPLVTDSVVSMPDALRDVCTVVGDNEPIAEAILAAGSKHSEADRYSIARWIASEHSFGVRVRQICESLK